MKTEQLIDWLAKEAGPAPRALAARRLWPVALVGVPTSALLAVAASPPVPAALLSEPGWWLKLGYAVLLALAAGAWLARLGRPSARDRRPRVALLAVFAIMLVIGLAQLWGAASGTRLDLLRGHSWATCARNVLLLSLPVLAGGFWALRGLAPTQPRRCGAVAGLYAGAVGAIGYTIICSELSPSFVVLWYSLGIAGAAAIGAGLGPRVLRW